MSSLLHDAAQSALSYGAYENVSRQQELSRQSYEDLRDLVITRVVLKIRELLKENNVHERLVLAFDGSTSFAKILQQRERRFGVNKSPIQNWTTNYISLATSFMNSVQNKLLNSIGKNEFNVSSVVFSPYNAPGEGEHKIFDILAKLSRDGQLSGTTVIHGLDADIILLTMTYNLSDIVIRQDRETSTNYIYASRIGGMLRDEFQHDASPDFMADFIAITCLLGNDFILPVLGLHGYDDDQQVSYALGDTLESLLITYKESELTLVDTDGYVIPRNVAKLLDQISDDDVIMANESHYLRITDQSNMPYGPVVNEVEKEVSRDSPQFADAFRDEYNKRLTLVKNIEVNVTSVLRQYVTTQEVARAKNAILSSFNIEDEVFNACVQYFSMMSWIVRLYTKGMVSINPDFFYFYPLAPLPQDLVKYASNAPINNEVEQPQEWLPSALQLKLILPASSTIPGTDLRPLASTNLTRYLYPQSTMDVPDLPAVYGKSRALIPPPLPAAIKDAANKVVRVYDSKKNSKRQHTMQYNLRKAHRRTVPARRAAAAPSVVPYMQRSQDRKVVYDSKQAPVSRPSAPSIKPPAAQAKESGRPRGAPVKRGGGRGRGRGGPSRRGMIRRPTRK